MKDVNNKTLQTALDLINSPSQDKFIEELETSVAQAIDETQGAGVAQVSSALELTQDEKKQLAKILTARLGRELDVLYDVNASLLGGFKITVGDWKFDATLLTQLETMKKILGGR